MTDTAERLYSLLPAIYRMRDDAQGLPLRALLHVAEQEADRLEMSIAALYDNWFIETCEEWVVPYIGDVLGVRDLPQAGVAGFSQRARVANTIAYRRRKGTAAMLEQLAQDVTGWPARAVEFFERLATTQHINHVRVANGYTVSLRDASALELVHGPFERATHTAEVRHIDVGRGRYNIPNIGLFLWRLQSYPMTRATGRRVMDAAGTSVLGYTFSPLGLDGALFNLDRTEAEVTHLAIESDVPAPLRRRPLRSELEVRRKEVAAGQAKPGGDYFGSDRAPVLSVFLGGSAQPLHPEELIICDLSDWRRPLPTAFTTSSGVPLFTTQVAVDPVNGRITVLQGSPDPSSVEVSYSYALAGDVGGGPYDRRASVEEWLLALDDPSPARGVTWQIGVEKGVVLGADPRLVPTVTDAVEAWNARPPGERGIIVLTDNRSYDETVAGTSIDIKIKPGSRLLIVAAAWPDAPDGTPPGISLGRLEAQDLRPHIRGDIVVTGTALSDTSVEGLEINGVIVEGTVTVEHGDLAELRLVHSTLVPGHGGMVVRSGSALATQNPRLVITIERSISARLDIADTVRELRIRESIIDASIGGGVTVPAIRGRTPDDPGPSQPADAPPTVVERATIIGETRTRTIEASNSIFTDRLFVARRQTGCVRFSYIPRGSLAPQRYRCQPPDEGSVELRPRFNSLTYGDPDYGQLAVGSPAAVARGADDENEMGVFNFLKQQQRIDNLVASLDEYLRFGLEAGVFLQT